MIHALTVSLVVVAVVFPVVALGVIVVSINIFLLLGLVHIQFSIAPPVAIVQDTVDHVALNHDANTCLDPVDKRLEVLTMPHVLIDHVH